MAKIKYTATDADGNVHTRSSARVYTHTVVVKYDLEGLLAQSRKYTKSYRELNLADHGYYTREAVSPKYCTPYRGETPEQLARRIQFDKDEAARWLAENGTDAEAYADRMEAASIAQCYSRAAKPFSNVGWCGRLDLAEKLADKYRNDPRCRDVTILQAEGR